MHAGQNPKSSQKTTPWWLLGIIFFGALVIAVFLSIKPETPSPPNPTPTSLAPASEPAVKPDVVLTPPEHAADIAPVEQLRSVAEPRNLEEIPIPASMPPVADIEDPIGMMPDPGENFLLGTPADPQEQFVLGTPQNMNSDQAIGELPTGSGSGGSIGTAPNPDALPPK